MSVYEITTEDGSVYEIETEDQTSPPAAAPPEDKYAPLNAQDTLIGGLSRLANTASLGYGDELMGAGNALLGAISGLSLSNLGEDYATGRDQARMLNEAWAEDNPNAAWAVDLPAMAALPVGKGLAAAKGLIGKGIAGAKLGSALGAVQGSGEGEGMEDRLLGAASGAGVGAVGGGLLSSLMALPGSIYNKVVPDSALTIARREVPALVDALGVGALKTPATIGERAATVAQGIGEKAQAEHDIASPLYNALKEGAPANVQPVLDSLRAASARTDAQLPSELAAKLKYLEAREPGAIERWVWPEGEAALSLSGPVKETLAGGPTTLKREGAMRLYSELGDIAQKGGPGQPAALEAQKELRKALGGNKKADELLAMFDEARGRWSEYKSYDEGLLGKIYQGGDAEYVNQIAGALVKDEAQTARIVSKAANDPNLLADMRALTTADVLRRMKTPGSAEQWITNRVGSFNKILGEKKTQVLLDLSRKEGTLGRALGEGKLAWLMPALGTAVGSQLGAAGVAGGWVLGHTVGKALEKVRTNRSEKLAQLIVDFATGNEAVHKAIMQPMSETAVQKFVAVAEKTGLLASLREVVQEAPESSALAPWLGFQDHADKNQEQEKPSVESHASNSLLTDALSQLNPFQAQEAQASMLPPVGMPPVMAAEAGMEKPSHDYGKLVQAVIQQESAGNPDAISPKGAQGLMQLMPATGKEWAAKLGFEKYDPKDPKQNVAIGSAYLKWLLGKFSGDHELGLASYNWGIGNVLKALMKASQAGKPRTWASISSMAPAETRKYVEKISKNYLA